jgi:hypothetical protein
LLRLFFLVTLKTLFRIFNNSNISTQCLYWNKNYLSFKIRCYKTGLKCKKRRFHFLLIDGSILKHCREAGVSGMLYNTTTRRTTTILKKHYFIYSTFSSSKNFYYIGLLHVSLMLTLKLRGPECWISVNCILYNTKFLIRYSSRKINHWV